mgnify:CR=1 FL=1
MYKLTSNLVISLLALMLVSPLQAQQDIVSKLLQCREISAADQRLQCYDALAADNTAATDAAMAATSEQESPPVPTEDETAPAASTALAETVTDDAAVSQQQLRREQQQLAAERRALEQEKQALRQQQQALAQTQSAQVQQAESEPAQAPPVLSEAEKIEAFGGEQVSSRVRKNKQAEQAASVDRILARVVTVRGDRRRGYILVLDNGQVWSQRGTRYIDFLSDEKMEVEIERNVMNGYRLNQLATNRRIFVERIR